MVRRWSCIIDINNNFTDHAVFFKNHKINLFRTSVNFKRFTFRYTKFKRKALIRLKHRTNWLIYTNVIKLWVKDYLFNKNYLRYQFFNKIFINNFFFYNFNFIKNRSNDLFYNFNFIFSTFTINRYLYYYKTKINYLQNSPLTVAWFQQSPTLNNSILPIYSSFDNYLISYNSKNDIFNFDDLFESIFLIFLKKNIEIKKIILLLFFFKTIKI